MPIFILIGLGLLGLVVYESQKKPAAQNPQNPGNVPPGTVPSQQLPSGYQYPCYPGYPNFPAGCTPNYQAPMGSPCLPGYPGWPPGCQPGMMPPGTSPQPGGGYTPPQYYPGGALPYPSPNNPYGTVPQPARISPNLPGRGKPGGAPAIIPLPVPENVAFINALADFGSRIIGAYNAFNDANSTATGPTFAPGSPEYKNQLVGVIGNILDTPLPGYPPNLWAGQTMPNPDYSQGPLPRYKPRYTTDPVARAKNIEEVRKTLLDNLQTGKVMDPTGQITRVICGLPTVSKALDNDPANADNYPECVGSVPPGGVVAGQNMAQARTAAMMKKRTIPRKRST